MKEPRRQDINTSTTSSDDQLLSSILRSSSPYPNPSPNSDSTQRNSQDQLPPSPFTPLPSSSPLIPFLETLTDRSKIYIIHVDTTPPAVKRRVFAIPLILNIFTVGLLLWRIWVMIPYYAAILRILPAKPEPQTLDTTSDGDADIFLPFADTSNGPDGGAPAEVPGKFHPSTLLLILRRTLTFFIDYILFFHVAAWPFSFFAERGGNPVHWRFWALRRFRDMEVVVRKSRGWGVEELRQTVSPSSSSALSSATMSKTTTSSSRRIIQGCKSPYFHTRITPMVRRTYLRDMTGYMMMGQYWDLDFGAMARVTEMLDDDDNDHDEKNNSQKDRNGVDEEIEGENKNDEKIGEVQMRAAREKREKMRKKGLTLEDCRTVVVVWDENFETAEGVGKRAGGAGGRRGGSGALRGSKSHSSTRKKPENDDNNDASIGQWLSWRVF